MNMLRRQLTEAYFEKGLLSFSQYGEDLVLDRLLANKATGTYIDIGANDPNHFSNTKRFYLRGWRGVNVEPDPALFRKLERHRKGDVNLNIGIGSETGRLVFYRLSADTLSTFDENIARTAEKEGYSIVEKLHIDVKPLVEIFETSFSGTHVDFLSLDVEGYEVPVLSSNDWERFRPSLLLVEVNRNTDQIYEYLSGQDYISIYSNGTNSIFADARSSCGFILNKAQG